MYHENIKKTFKFIFLILMIINVNFCYKDGKITSPFEENEKTDGKVCAALYIYCDNQYNECKSINTNLENCTQNYQGCNNTVRGCISSSFN